MTPVLDEAYLRYLRRLSQRIRVSTVSTRPTCVVLPFHRNYEYRVGVGGIFQQLNDSGNTHAHRG
ncbi:MAG: hypothetical protein ABW034_19385 [Steroidobacteraceae bacterium]